MPITNEEDAILTCVRMSDQGIKPEAIAEHLKAEGFVSPKTKVPWKPISVRLKVREFRKMEQEEAKAESAILVKPAADDFVNACKHLLDTPSELISNAMKQKMIVALLNMSGNDRQ